MCGRPKKLEGAGCWWEREFEERNLPRGQSKPKAKLRLDPLAQKAQHFLSQSTEN